MTRYSPQSILLCITCILIPLIIGFVGSFFTVGSISGWYATLAKPWFNPPNWLFGPVWTILYILMGISLYLVVRNGLSDGIVRKAVIVYGAQLFINLLWSIVFFGWHSPGGAFITIIILFILIMATILTFWKINRNAAYLLIPYICWTGFAMLLNGAVMIIN